MHRISFLLFLFPLTSHAQISQDSAAFFIREIYRQSYTELQSYAWLTTLTKEIGPRLSGSDEAAEAVKWAQRVLDTIGSDKVWLQETMVPKWERGDREQIILFSKTAGAVPLTGLALGNSPGTGAEGLKAEVIEVQSLDQLR